MVQFTDAAGGGQVEPAPVPPQAAPNALFQPLLTPVDQLPVTSLVQQQPLASYPQAPASPYTQAPVAAFPQTFNEGASSSDMVPQVYQDMSTQNPVPFYDHTTLYPQPVSGDFTSDVLPSSERMFDVVPVCGSHLDKAQRGFGGEVESLAAQTGVQNPLADSVDSLNSSKGYSSDSSSDVYMNSDYTDTLNSVSSCTLLLANHAREVASPIAETKEEESPTVESVCYNNEAFIDSSANKALISWSSDESVEDGTTQEAQHDTTEHKTVTWADTIAETICVTSEPVPYTTSAEPDNAEHKDEGKHLEVTWAPSVVEHAVGETSENEEGKHFINLEPGCTLEALVQQLAEHTPADVVNIDVEVLDGPVYEALTEPLTPEFEVGGPNWLQSTESLHLYKLLKQGRAHNVDDLRISAMTNLKTNTMNNLHERSSFVNLTASSVNSLGRACQTALSYVRSDMEFGSAMSLRDSNLKMSSSLSLGSHKGHHPLSEENDEMLTKKKGDPAVDSGRHTKNVLLVSLVATILLVSINAVRNLQSSLNQEGGVGVICLAVMYAAYVFGSLFSPVFVQGLGVKRCITGGLIVELLYVAANLYPAIWLMLPASMAGGFSMAVIWNAVSTYIVLLSHGEADSKQLKYDSVSEKYFSYFCLIYQSNLVIGNLIASLVLTFASGPANASMLSPLVNGTMVNATLTNLTYTQDNAIVGSLAGGEQLAADLLGMADAVEQSPYDGSLVNSTLTAAFDAAKDSHYHLCGAEFCHHFVITKEESAVPIETVYLLFGIFMALLLVAVAIAVFLLEPLSSKLFNASQSSSTVSLASSSAKNALGNVKKQLVSLAKFCRNAKFLCLLPLFTYSIMQFAFVCSEVMMAYVTCPMGVWLVGYSMMAYGVFCSLASYVTQVAVQRTGPCGRGFFIGLAAALNIGLLVFMRVWQPHPDTIYPLFILTSLFGIADGIWNINANSLCGSVFPDHYEEAFTGLRLAQGLGGAFSMGYASFFCMAFKLYTMMGVVVIVMAGYIGAEILIRRDTKKSVIVYEKEIV